MNADRSLLTRRVSRHTVAEVMLRQGPISRADLAKITGLSKQTMSEVVAELEAGGLVAPVGVNRGAVGRTSVTYEIARGAAYSLGVDLGGTKMIAALANLAGEVVAEQQEATDPRGGLHVLTQVRRMATSLAASAKVPAERIRSVVLGTPGVVSPASGAIALVPNISGLSEIDVGKTLSGLFGFAVSIENDVNLAMLGEAWQGCAQGCEDAAFLALGTGIGLGLIVNGKLARGATGAAGEISYLPIGGDVASREALHAGAFELEVGAQGIVRRYRAAGGADAATVREVFARLEAGDAVAATVVDETARMLALAITALYSIVDPQIIVLGGNIGIRPELIERVRREMPAVFARPANIVPSTLGNRAALVGAVSSAVNRLHNELFGVADLPGELSLPGSLSRAAE
ncbi:ROK family transcriptional regulator [Mesorhizobium sp. INR15]|uniref:ROK family transcriptional regulator n=1 Tax=Mesorhizobium sp. INR15 TaxID=2654248 RepID=UPI0018964296|nr:ROK family transcriptional regulator [Mesorhizobium sp. INR15]QPC89377.1 ROK family protein [Mesorhizobium sp. INR15]